MSHSFGAWYCEVQRRRDENRTVELGNSVQDEEKDVTKTSGFGLFDILLSVC